jgi:hypothetical protein
MSLAENRTLRAFAVIALGAGLFALRRWLLPTFFEQQGVPFDIAVPSNLSSCLQGPALATCSDAVVVVLAVVGVVAAVGWGNLGMLVFAIILALPPLLLYFAGSPIWAPLIALAFIPIALEIGIRLLIPPAEES